MFRQALCRTSLKHLPKSYKLRIVCFIKIQKGSRRKPVKKGRSIGPWHYRLRRHPVWRCLEPCLGLSCSVCFPDLVCLSLLPIDQLAHHFPIHFNWVGSKKTAVGPSSTGTTFPYSIEFENNDVFLSWWQPAHPYDPYNLQKKLYQTYHLFVLKALPSR